MKARRYDYPLLSDHRLMLQAALLDREEAERSLHKWEERFDPARVDSASLGLLPLLYLNLARHGLDSKHRTFLGHQHAHQWYRNELLLKQALPPLDALLNAEIPLVALKGLALLLVFYRDTGARSIADLDLLIPRDKLATCDAIMKGCGWRPTLHPRVSLFDDRFFHSMEFRREPTDEVAFDLHVHMDRHLCGSAPPFSYWNRIVPLTVRGRPLYRLSNTDCLLNICLHGVVWNKHPSIRWIADALMILRAGGNDLDWPLLLRNAIELDVQPQVLAALDTLGLFYASVPSDVIVELERAPVTAVSAKIFELEQRDLTLHPIKTLLLHWFMYRRGVRGRNGLSLLAGFYQYCRFWTQAESGWKVLFLALCRAAGLYRAAIRELRLKLAR